MKPVHNNQNWFYFFNLKIENQGNCKTVFLVNICIFLKYIHLS